MDLSLLIKGLVIGFSIAAPVGPIGLLCIVRTLSAGRASGLVTGLGAATADGMYGCIGGFGVAFLTEILIDQQIWLRLIGGVFLVYLGIRNLTSRPAETAPQVRGSSLLADFGSTFVLTLTNPMTVISFGAVFASLGVGTSSGTRLDAVTLLIGIFSGSALWWIVLSTSVSLFRVRIQADRLGWINKAAGAIIAAFGTVALMSIVSWI